MSPFLQRFSVYLGHPTYTLSIILFSMILFAGALVYTGYTVVAGRAEKQPKDPEIEELTHARGKQLFLPSQCSCLNRLNV